MTGGISIEELQRLSNAGIIPVVVLEDEKKAVYTAEALLAGGIDVMEITFRTATAPESIKAVIENCPNMLVGAGTVMTLEQCKRAVEMGASFIVSPGFNEEIVQWCVTHDIAVVPGCVTPTEIMEALALGVTVVKFFPANVYGGLSAMKALSAPFPNIKFIPTGGVTIKNLSELILAPYIHAVGGSWICNKADISEGNFEKITRLCKEAREALLGFHMKHVGINCENEQSSMDVCQKLNKAFGFPIKEGNSSNFSTSAIEVMKSIGSGESGHIAIGTNSMNAAIGELRKHGFTVDMKTAKYKGDRMIAVYLKESFGGFAIHLLQQTGG